jgi:hypothetical protein
VPLLLQDRNFGLDEAGRLTGQLVHKTDPEDQARYRYQRATGTGHPDLVRRAQQKLRAPRPTGR